MHIVIVGYGLAGRLCALALAPHAKVSVLTQESSVTKSAVTESMNQQSSHHQNNEQQSAAGWKAAAMLAPVAESVHASEQVVAMGWHSMTLWHNIIKKLPMSVFMQQTGSLLLAHPQDLSLMAQFRQQVQRSEKHRITPLGRNQIHQLEPELQPNLQHGLLLSGEGQIDNLALFRAIDAMLAEQGVAIHWQRPIAQINAQALAEHGNTEHADWVIDCRGLGAKPAWQQIASSGQGTLRGVRGEIMRVHAPDVAISRPVRLMHPRYPLYIVPKPNHQFVLGATQIESEDDSPISVRSTLDLLSAAYSVHPGFAEARIISAESGLRPAFADHQPKIHVDAKQRIVSVNGLFRHGYLIGPAVSELVQHIVLGTPSRPTPPWFTSIVHASQTENQTENQTETQIEKQPGRFVPC